MSGLFSLKRKAHYLVNYLFYFLIFGVGFLIGLFFNNNFDLKSIFEVLL